MCLYLAFISASWIDCSRSVVLSHGPQKRCVTTCWPHTPTNLKTPVKTVSMQNNKHLHTKWHILLWIWAIQKHHIFVLWRSLLIYPNVLFQFTDNVGIKTTVYAIIAAKKNMSIPNPETRDDFLKCECLSGLLSLIKTKTILQNVTQHILLLLEIKKVSKIHW